MAAKSYPIIGGPLNGQRANYADFQRGYTSRIGPEYDQVEGQFSAYKTWYIAFNRANRYDKVPTMVWLWKSLLP